MSYIERERQRSEALQQEQLDWLHAHHRELAEQTRLLREIAKHTGLQYALTVLLLVLLGLAAVVALLAGLVAGGSGVRAVCAVLGLGVVSGVVSALVGRRRRPVGDAAAAPRG